MSSLSWSVQFLLKAIKPENSLSPIPVMNPAWATLWFVVMTTAINPDSRFCERSENIRVTGTVVFSKLVMAGFCMKSAINSFL